MNVLPIDIAVANLFRNDTSKRQPAFMACGLHIPDAIAFYRRLRVLHTIVGPDDAIELALIAYTVADPNYNEANTLPIVTPEGKYVYGHALVTLPRMRPHGMSATIGIMREQFPNATHFYGFRGTRKTRLMPLWR